MMHAAGNLLYGGLAALGQAEGPVAPVPQSTAWSVTLLVVIVWILVAAAIIGPLVKFFRAEPRSGQVFEEDKAGRV